MAAIFDFNGSWRLGERKKFVLWGRSTVKNKKKKGGGGGVKILALFLTETSEQHKERLLGVVTFCLFFPTRFVWDFFRDDYN